MKHQQFFGFLQTLETAAAMLGLGVQNLESMLTLKVVPVTRGEVFTKKLGIKEAVRARDAAIKTLYEVSITRGDFGAIDLVYFNIHGSVIYTFLYMRGNRRFYEEKTQRQIRY